MNSLEGESDRVIGYGLMGQLRHRDVPHLSAQGRRLGAELRVQRTQQTISNHSSTLDLKP